MPVKPRHTLKFTTQRTTPQATRLRPCLTWPTQRGQGMTEYIIIVALIAVAAIGAFTYFGQTIRSQTAGIAKEVSGQAADTQIQAAKTAAGEANTQANKAKGLGSYNNNEAKEGAGQ